MKLLAEINKQSADLTVELTAEELKQYLDLALSEKLKDFSADGFRKGKFPKATFVKKYGIESVYPEAIDIVLNDVYPKIVVENKLDVIAAPEFNWEQLTISEAEGFSVTGVVEIMPEITLEGYADVNKEVELEKVKVTKSEVDAEIKKLIENKAVIEVKEDAAINGDIVVIDFEGFKNGVAFDGGKGDNYPLTLGSNSFIPGFEEQLIGASAGEQVEVAVTFPSDYQADDLAGADVVFKCTVHEVKGKKLPRLTKEIIADTQGYEATNKEELVTAVEAKLLSTKEENAKNKYNGEIITKLIALGDVEAPNAMITQETDATIANFKQQISQQGMEFEMYIQMLGMTEEALRADMDRESKRKIEEMLVLEAVVKAENYVITEEEITAKIEELASTSGMTVEEVKTAIGDDSRLKRDMVYDRAYKLILGE